MRSKIVAGNWKMNHVSDSAYPLIDELEKYLIGNPLGDDREVVVAPPFVFLEATSGKLEMVPGISTAAQNCHQEASGAYTGEVSAGMIKSIGAKYVILGHSERRAYFGESDELVREKLDRVLAEGLQPIFCCGEPESERDSGSHRDWVRRQVEAALFHLEEDAVRRCVIAYEPIWAIGTGKTASPEQAQEMHQFIRFLLEERFGGPVGETATILYGGSCKPGNAAELFSQPDVDGGLIGGASLKSEDFIGIIEAL